MGPRRQGLGSGAAAGAVAAASGVAGAGGVDVCAAAVTAAPIAMAVNAFRRMLPLMSIRAHILSKMRKCRVELSAKIPRPRKRESLASRLGITQFRTAKPHYGWCVFLPVVLSRPHGTVVGGKHKRLEAPRRFGCLTCL